MNSRAPIVKDLVLVGGGHSHVEVLRRFGMRPIPGVRLTLVSRSTYSPYSGMLPGLIAGHYEFDETHIDLRRLARFAGARFYASEAIGLDPEGKRVLCDDRPPVPYDLLSINIGSTPNTADVPGAAQYTVPVKPISRFVAHWRVLKDGLEQVEGPLRIGIVGGGAGGVEITLAIQYRLARLLADPDHGRQGGARTEGHGPDLEFHLVTAGDELLETHNRWVRRKFRCILRERGVRVHKDRTVTRVEAGRVRCADGTTMEFDRIIWVISAGASGWPGGAGLAVDSDGFIRVDSTLRSISHSDVFAAGDVAAMVDQPRPKAGVFAVRQGPPLAKNLRRALLGRPLLRFEPQRKFLSLISTGDRYAVASRSWWALEGRWVWRWKDWIDRRWIRRYEELPEMEEMAPEVPEGLADEEALQTIAAFGMRCAGCGGKVGSGALERALEDLATVSRDDVDTGLEGRDDAAVIEAVDDELTVLSVDTFRPLIEDPYVSGKIAANHCLGDIFAMGAEPQSALAIVTLPYALEDKVEADLRTTMAGAAETFAEVGATIAGGHTAEGPEASLGFAVTGRVARGRLWRKSGLRSGDRLILTKPVGTGTLFAAAMRLEAEGRWIDAAIESMLESSAEAARCLGEHGTRACTDVTGFGVIGHLLEMARASAVNVEIELDALPALDGALETVQAGIFSSLQPSNLRLRRAIEDPGRLAERPAYALLFDPQTAGGLLAGVPADRAERCVEELRRLGYDRAAILGTVGAPAGGEGPRIRLVTKRSSRRQAAGVR